MLSQEASEAMNEMMRNLESHRDYALNVPLEKQRSDWESYAAADILPARVKIESVTAGGVPADWVSAAGADRQAAIMYFHGGGGNQGSNVTCRKLAARISVKTNIPVLVLNYPLAPENPFPAAINGSAAAYFWLAEKIKPERIILGGDSTGGGLAMSLLLALKGGGQLSDETAAGNGCYVRPGTALPKAVFLLSPLVDFTLSGSTMKSNGAIDPVAFEADLRLNAECYCAGADPKDPLVSPLFGNLSGFPPLFIQTGSAEVLLSDSTRLAEKAKAAGVDVTLDIWEGMWHVFQARDGIPESEQALEKVGGFVRRYGKVVYENAM